MTSRAAACSSFLPSAYASYAQARHPARKPRLVPASDACQVRKRHEAHAALVADGGTVGDLFVDLAAIGAGAGGALFRAARELARREGFRRLLIHNDPNAVPFYVRHGARQIGEVASGSIPGRLLPLLAVELAPDL